MDGIRQSSSESASIFLGRLILHEFLILSHVIDPFWHSIWLKAMLVHELVSSSHYLLPRVATQHTVVPYLNVRILLQCIFSWGGEERGIKTGIPR